MPTEDALRIVVVITRLDVGGAQETAVRCVSCLDASRFRPLLATGTERSNEAYQARLKAAGVPLVALPELWGAVRPVSDLRALLVLVRLFRSEGPDVVHTHSSKAGVLGRVAARVAGVPVTVHTVHGWSFHAGTPALLRRAVVLLERALARLTTSFVVVGEADRAIGIAQRIGTPARYAVIRSGLDLARFRAVPGVRERTRAAFGLVPGQPIVGTVGRLARQKSPKTFVEVAHAVRERRPDARFLMVGDGPLRDETARRIREAGLDDMVMLLGERVDVEEVLSTFDVFLLTSRWEGLPRTVVEAMAAGVPVVAAGVGSVPEVVRHGATGLLVAPGDVAGFAEAVLALVDDPALGPRLAAAAEGVVGEFDQSTMVARHEELYERLVAQARSAPRRRRMARPSRTASPHERK